MPDPLTDPPAGPPRRRLPGPLAGQLAFPLPGGARALFTDRSLANLSTLRGPASEPTLTRR
ncbi:MAG TPA: hypothetical protein VMG62_05535, partial [Solirubrobacteraceae bacterium]|nr:hypothetical protein [Solirubrobacteraceae bacterium]